MTLQYIRELLSSDQDILAAGNAAVEVVAGVNLPMLIQLVRSRQTHKLKDAALDAADAGRKYISVASKILNDRKK